MLLNTWNSHPRTPESSIFSRAGAARPKPTNVRRFLPIELQHRYTMVLISIVTLLFALPFIERNEAAILPLKLVFTIVLLFGISGGRRMRRDLIVGAALALPAMGGRWLPQYSSDPRVPLVIDILTTMFLLYVTIMILKRVLSSPRVTMDTVAGAVCSYFLIGLAGAFVYRAMFAIHPHSFLIASRSSGLIFENNSQSQPRLTRFVYYSFTTLTTTGFGDITAASGPARALSLLEAMAGQFFLAVLIARLVSLELIHSRRGEPE